MLNNFPKVAIIGRPNVGKSTLFNRIIQKKHSITLDEPGVTRDRIYYQSNWLNKNFIMIDTGGFTIKKNDNNFQEKINSQVEFALEEADIIIFLTSIKEGLTTEDISIAKRLKNLGKNKKVILVVNKIDNFKDSYASNEFYKLGFKDFINISSIHGIGIGDLLNEVVKDIKEIKSVENNILKLGIIGKPNVGKSTLVNKILNDNRIIVSDIPGTTRDSINSFIKIDNDEYQITDTAGLKKKQSTLSDIEWYSELRSKRVIETSDILILLIDPLQGFTKIDEKILGLAVEQFKTCMIVINKIDALEKNGKEKILEEIGLKTKFAPWIKIHFLSALKDKSFNNLFKVVKDLEEQKNTKIKNSKLNEFLMEIQMIKKPPRYNGIEIKLSYIILVDNGYPKFVIFTNHPDKIHFSYERFLQNQLRIFFNLKNVPMEISFKKK